MGNTADSSADNMGFRCAKTVPGGPDRKPRGYVYDQRKKKRPPPGVGDPLKDGGKAAEQLVQAIIRACDNWGYRDDSGRPMHRQSLLRRVLRGCKSGWTSTAWEQM